MGFEFCGGEVEEEEEVGMLECMGAVGGGMTGRTGGAGGGIGEDEEE